jgi:hypothetical protein
MATAIVLDREEYIEQAYFFRVLRERLAEALATQEVLEQIDQEVLSTTRLPYAIQFLASELKHTGLLSSGFARLPHYFTAFQAFVIQGTEEENRRFSIDTGLLVLEREAEYRADKVTPAGLFIFHFEVLCRNRLGYDNGLRAMGRDPFYAPDWRAFIEMTRQLGGVLEFAELVYIRSELYLMERRRTEPEYEPSLPPLFGEKEGKIAKASRNRDPLFLFAALQRQLGYPEVPRARPRDDLRARLEALEMRLNDLEVRLKLMEGELHGKVDLSDLGKPDILSQDE